MPLSADQDRVTVGHLDDFAGVALSPGTNRPQRVAGPRKSVRSAITRSGNGEGGSGIAAPTLPLARTKNHDTMAGAWPTSSECMVLQNHLRYPSSMEALASRGGVYIFYTRVPNAEISWCREPARHISHADDCAGTAPRALTAELVARCNWGNEFA